MPSSYYGHLGLYSGHLFYLLQNNVLGFLSSFEKCHGKTHKSARVRLGAQRGVGEDGPTSSPTQHCLIPGDSLAEGRGLRSFISRVTVNNILRKISICGSPRVPNKWPQENCERQVLWTFSKSPENWRTSSRSPHSEGLGGGLHTALDLNGKHSSVVRSDRNSNFPHKMNKIIVTEIVINHHMLG